MKYHFTTLTTLLIFLLAVAGSSAADTMVIKYRSGKTQTVTLDEAHKDVQSVEFIETPSSPKEQTDLGENKLPDGKGGKEQQKRTKKSGPTIKWAPPLSE